MVETFNELVVCLFESYDSAPIGVPCPGFRADEANEDI